MKLFEDMIRLLACAVIWGVLMLLYFKMGKGIVPFLVFVGCSFVFLAWVRRVNERLRDAGLSRWYGIPFLCLPMTLSLLLAEYKFVNPAIALALFVLTQVPIAFLRRKPKPPEATLVPNTLK
jgi:hypothetical protein